MRIVQIHKLRLKNHDTWCKMLKSQKTFDIEWRTVHNVEVILMGKIFPLEFQNGLSANFLLQNRS